MGFSDAGTYEHGHQDRVHSHQQCRARSGLGGHLAICCVVGTECWLCSIRWLNLFGCTFATYRGFLLNTQQYKLHDRSGPHAKKDFSRPCNTTYHADIRHVDVFNLHCNLCEVKVFPEKDIASAPMPKLC